MADISMCSGVKTEILCKTCYRKNATQNPYRQSYIQPAIRDGDCRYYWPETWKYENARPD